MEMVNHPIHYGGEDNTYEVIKIIEHYKLNFCKGNVLKYLLRAGKKFDGKEIEDLEKSLWYLQREIDTLKKERVSFRGLDSGIVLNDNTMYSYDDNHTSTFYTDDIITLTGFDNGSNTSITITT